MNSAKSVKFYDTARHAAERGLCPQCGTPMAETFRSMEKNFIYIWYDCPEPYCGGQWLEKADFPNVTTLITQGTHRITLSPGVL
jgi:hypothetical protein